MRNRYQTMVKSAVVKDTATDEFYPDPMTLPIDLFSFSNAVVEYQMDQNDIDRSDLMMSTYYGIAEGDDIILWLSDLPFIYDEAKGVTIELPRKRDIDKFFTLYTE